MPDDQIEAALDNILQSSLWQRRLLRVDDASRAAYRTTLLTRSRYIWANSTAVRRRGYFLAGLGLEAGHALDAVAPEANLLLIQANAALAASDHEAAIAAITGIAERVFTFYPFEPDPFPANWRDILRFWLLGQPLAAIVAGQEAEALQFIEGGLVYRLPWAMEALRVRAAANGDVVGILELALADHELGLAVPAVETGTMNRSASIHRHKRVWPSSPREGPHDAQHVAYLLSFATKSDPLNFQGQICRINLSQKSKFRDRLLRHLT